MDNVPPLPFFKGTHRSLLQHHSLKASILWCSAFLMVQLSQPYIATGKTIVLMIHTFVGKGMSLLLSRLSRFDIAFLPRSKCLLMCWLQSPTVVILEPRKIKSVTPSISSPSICQELRGPEGFLNVEFQANFCTLLLLLHQEFPIARAK
uniref:Uncharacterized protein n=1 Tax=Laticauda laticaudata TaxID=8630 RepID=A0A8C5WNH6_LATLA